MKPLIICFLIFFSISFSYSAEGITNYLNNGELIIYFPQFNDLIDSVTTLMKRFYGANYESTLKKTRLIIESDYGVDIFDEDNLQSIGIDPEGAFAFVHTAPETGYLILTLLSAYDFNEFADSAFNGDLNYKIEDDYVILSKDIESFSNFQPELVTNKAFKVAKKKLDFDWDMPFIWMSGEYVPEMVEGSEEYDWDELPYSFLGAVIDIHTNGIDVEAYSGVYKSTQPSKLRNIQIIITERSYQALDYIEGNPILIARFCVNHNSFFKYLRDMDIWDVIGFQAFDDEMFGMGVDLDNYLIDIADGRLNLVIDSIDSESGDIDLYGSIGILFTNAASTLFTTIQSPLEKWGGTLDTFEIFAHEFYQYEINDLVIYYGIIADDIIFSTDMDHLKTMVGNIYANKPGYLKGKPEFFKQAVTDDTAGFFAVFDVQSFLAQLSDIGLDIKSEFLIGIENVWIQSVPDSGYDAYGWESKIKINFY